MIGGGDPFVTVRIQNVEPILVEVNRDERQ
jgi:hypothetical protein